MPGGESIPDKENLRKEIRGILWNSNEALEGSEEMQQMRSEH